MAQENLKQSTSVLLRAIAEKEDGTVDTTTDSWDSIVASAYGTFDGTIATVESDDLEPSAQTLEPEVVGEDAAADFTVNLRQSNIQKLLQGLFRNEFVERGSTRRIKQITGGETVTSVASDGYVTTNTTSANGWSVPTGGNLLVCAAGFQNKTNNGRKFATAVTATKVSVTGLTADATDAGGRLYVCGYQTATTAAYTKATNTKLAAITADADISGFNLAKGEWVQVVDTNAHPTDVKLFYGRIARSTTTGNKTTLVFDIVLPDKSWTDANVSSKKLSILFANRYINNPDEGNIKDKCFSIERVVSRANPVEAELAKGSTVNTLTLSMPVRSKATANLAFIANEVQANKSQTASSHRPAFREAMFNTSKGLPVIRLTDSRGNLLATSLTDLTLNFANGVTPVPALQTTKNVGVVHSNFTLGITATAIFNNADAKRAAIENETCSLVIFLRNKDGGIALEIPNLKLTGAATTVALGSPVNVSLTKSVFKGEADYMLRWNYFYYLER